ncbi:hypothetical protein LAZ67_19001585 [Cordylochernes scorpioides]|uniref:Uncharacterized protein n=1 Tax=Cordylochernes scorpioides TaxID=51811 RepID=A0ABY6LMK2_9ARAC|nr:hypothetical protein LAZ67_19001585 [Cordylochernes scorpioides]
MLADEQGDVGKVVWKGGGQSNYLANDPLKMANADQKPLEAPTVEVGVTTGGDAGFDPIPFNPSLNIRKYAGDED